MRELTALQVNLRFCRKVARFTQVELAERLGISPTTLAGYENAGKDPKIKTLIKLADFFGVSVDELIRTPLKAETIGKLRAKKW